MPWSNFPVVFNEFNFQGFFKEALFIHVFFLAYANLDNYWEVLTYHGPCNHFFCLPFPNSQYMLITAIQSTHQIARPLKKDNPI